MGKIGCESKSVVLRCLRQELLKAKRWGQGATIEGGRARKILIAANIPSSKVIWSL